MRRERIADGIHVFTCERYFEVTAGVVVTTEGVIVIDTFPFPAESRALRDFAEAQRAGPVRYVVLTHSHGDHSYGSFLFPEADFVAQDACRRLLQRFGQAALDKAKEETPELAPVQLRLPNITVSGQGGLHLGNRSLDLIHTPGHTPDGLSVYVREEKVLFAGDAMMPIPYIPHGDPDQLIQTLRSLKKLGVDHLVQGHGRPLLRGEVNESLDLNIAYIRQVRKRVQALVEKGAPPEALRDITLESCGMSRMPLGGLVEQLHRANLLHLYETYRKAASQ
ncbi:MAG: MBL fold metallo-hydrolase [Anaerolineae bacterium]|nr:MBL fold metallo-hydrolase [Anaerolineae bacterium]